MNGWWLSEARRIGGEIRGFSPKAGTRVSSCRSFWFEKNTRSLPSTAIESLKPLVWPKSGSGFASNHWFGLNRGSVLLQTIGLAPIGGRFCFKPLVWPKSEVGFASNHWFGPNRGRVLLQTTWFGSNRGRVLLQTTWFGLNRGRFCFKPPGLTPIGGRFCFKPPGLTPIVGRFCFKPPGLAPIGGRFCFKPPGLAPIGVGFASKAIPILGLVRAESKDPAPARGGTGP